MSTLCPCSTWIPPTVPSFLNGSLWASHRLQLSQHCPRQLNTMWPTLKALLHKDPPRGQLLQPSRPIARPLSRIAAPAPGSRWAEPLSGLIHDCTMENCSLRCPRAARNCCSTLKVPLPSFCTDPGAWRNVLFTWGRYWALLTKATPCSPSATKICLLNPTQ